MAKATLPRNGSDEAVLASTLNNLTVWKCLLLHSTFADQHTDADVARRINAALAGSGLEVRPDQVSQLYWLAVGKARKETTAKKAA
ncbi:MAG TPA: hypothetical protein VGE74_18385 [Gemmata sp.]